MFLPRLMKCQMNPDLAALACVYTTGMMEESLMSLTAFSCLRRRRPLLGPLIAYLLRCVDTRSRLISQFENSKLLYIFAIFTNLCWGGTANMGRPVGKGRQSGSSAASPSDVSMIDAKAPPMNHAVAGKDEDSEMVCIPYPIVFNDRRTRLLIS